jgi:hypothetical protein
MLLTGYIQCVLEWQSLCMCLLGDFLLLLLCVCVVVCVCVRVTFFVLQVPAVLRVEYRSAEGRAHGAMPKVKKLLRIVTGADNASFCGVCNAAGTARGLLNGGLLSSLSHL